jgi:hypothetical protein
MTNGMDPSDAGGAGALTPAGSATAPARSEGATDLAEVLERILDKGVVIAGDVRVNLLDIELLTIKLRLIIAGVDTARRMGLNWWETDPWLTRQEAEEDNRSLGERVGRLERLLESSLSGNDRALEEENRALREQLEHLQRQIEPGRSSKEAGDD